MCIFFFVLSVASRRPGNKQNKIFNLSNFCNKKKKKISHKSSPGTAYHNGKDKFVQIRLLVPEKIGRKENGHLIFRIEML